MQSRVVEMAPFRLADGVTVEQVAEASRRLEEEFLAGLPGYLGRCLLRGGQDEWMDLVFWRTPEDAARAMEAAASSAACAAYFACMAGVDHDAADSGVTLYRQVASYGAMAI